MIKIGDKVKFHRGMFGEWQGTVRQIYTGRDSRFAGEEKALISFKRSNGTFGKARVPVRLLTKVEPLIEVSPGLAVDPRGGFVQLKKP